MVVAELNDGGENGDGRIGVTAANSNRINGCHAGGQVKRAVVLCRRGRRRGAVGGVVDCRPRENRLHDYLVVHVETHRGSGDLRHVEIPLGVIVITTSDGAADAATIGGRSLLGFVAGIRVQRVGRQHTVWRDEVLASRFVGDCEKGVCPGRVGCLEVDKETSLISADRLHFILGKILTREHMIEAIVGGAVIDHDLHIPQRIDHILFGEVGLIGRKVRHTIVNGVKERTDCAAVPITFLCRDKVVNFLLLC